MLSGSTIYGMTESGGDTSLDDGNGAGVVFSLPIIGGTPTALLVFSGTNGAGPQGSLTLSGSTLFGTTIFGGKYYANQGFGPSGYGNIFSINTSGRWADFGPGTSPRENAENRGDFSENEPNGPIGPILGRRGSKESAISPNSIASARGGVPFPRRGSVPARDLGGVPPAD